MTYVDRTETAAGESELEQPEDANPSRNFVGQIVNMVVPVQFVIYYEAEVLVRADYFNQGTVK